MTTPVLTTKMHIPAPRPDLVPRPRLVRRLDEGLRSGHRLTLLSAPAGFGKTTLLSEWIYGGECGRTKLAQRVAWLSLDEGDNDPVRFWTHFVVALQRVEPDLGETGPAALQSVHPLDPESRLTSLINEIGDLVHPLILILDDFHAITTSEINRALRFLLDNLPAPMHLVVSSRADPPWPLARLRSRRQIIEIRIDDLRFSAAEAAAFLNDVMGLGLSAEEVSALDSRTEGWIAGLQLAALSMQGREDSASFISAFSGSHRFILDYLIEEVLHRQSAEVQEFLLRTAILERMTSSLCDRMIGSHGDRPSPSQRQDDELPVSLLAHASSHEILTHLERNNLFLISLDDERQWYRYHRLFADLLRSRLEQTYPGQVPSLHQRASEWYEGSGLIEEAVAHAFAGADMERAANLIQAHGLGVIGRSESLTLSRWLDALDGDLIRARPWLSIFRAWTLYWIGQREGSEESLQHAEQPLSASPPPSSNERDRIAGHIATIRAYNALVNKDIPRVVETAQRALHLLPESAYMHGLAALVLGAAHAGQGNVVAAQAAFGNARAVAQKSGHHFLAVSATCYQGMQQARQGLLEQAFATYGEALALATGPDGRELPPAGYPLVKLGDLSREWNDMEAATRLLHKGVELCTRWGQVDILADGYIGLTRLQLAQTDLRGATDTLREADRLLQRAKVDPWIPCWLDDCRLRIWLAQGDLDAAAHWAEASGLNADDELSYQHDLHHINLARVLVAQSSREPSGPHLDQALELLTRLQEAAETAGWVSETIKVLILQALALQASDKSESALTALARALTLAEPGGYVRTFVDAGAPMAHLLHLAASRSIATQYALKLLSQFEAQAPESLETRPKTPPFPRPSTMGLIEPLSPRELQVLRLLTSHLSRTDIAHELTVSVNTIRSHVKSIYGKLGVHSRGDAVERGRQLGLL